MNEHRPKIYIECTHTYTADVLTGIQRVVRQVAAQAPFVQDALGVEVVLVLFTDGRFHAVPAIPGEHPGSGTSHADEATGAQPLSRALIAQVSRLSKRPGPVFVKNLLRRFLPPLFGRLQTGYTTLKFRHQQRELGLAGPLDPVEPGAGDILFMLDSSWHLPVWPAVEAARQRGAKVICAVYDLIPVNAARYCDPHVAARFRNFLGQAVTSVDGFIAISATVQNQLADYIASRHPQQANRPVLSYCHLGADFAGNGSRPGRVRSELRDWLADHPATYLMVGTIEPRKNHGYLLDAFDLHWSRGGAAALCLVGRQGWMVGKLMQRLRSHPQRGRQLSVWHDLGDDELGYCYQQARALVFPSIIEGFGLPIIESLQHGLPVIASDIPIHREIGGDAIQYIPLDDPGALARLIDRIEAKGIPECYMPRNFRWLSWRDATEQLLGKLLWIARAG